MKELEQKIAGMKSIDKNFDAGNSVTLEAAEAVLADSRASLEDYNSTLALADEKQNVFESKDRSARDFNRKVLPAAGLKYGRDSSEYEKLGGVRDSERKKPVRKKKELNP
jgi:hypothetical protein